RVGFALRELHDLADEETQHLFLAGAVLLHLGRILADDAVHERLDGRRIADLAQAAAFDDGIGVAFALPHGVEYFLGDLAGDGAILDAPQKGPRRRGRDRAGVDAEARPVQRRR